MYKYNVIRNAVLNLSDEEKNSIKTVDELFDIFYKDCEKLNKIAEQINVKYDDGLDMYYIRKFYFIFKLKMGNTITNIDFWSCLDDDLNPIDNSEYRIDFRGLHGNVCLLYNQKSHESILVNIYNNENDFKNTETGVLVIKNYDTLKNKFHEFVEKNKKSFKNLTFVAFLSIRRNL